MKKAARLTDMHDCPMTNPDGSAHVGGPIDLPCCDSVLIGGQPAARKSDSAICTGPLDRITGGSCTVRIGNKKAARKGDPTLHGGRIAMGCGTVRIGD